jgi:hypothetical protein
VNADALLSKLDNVRQSGKGWRADCPNGHEHARGSLSITEGDDGRVLITCFACHDTPGILAALGMSVADLFPHCITHNATPQERKELRQRAREGQWRAALAVLAYESLIVEAAAAQIPPEIFSPEDRARLALAFSRIHQAREVLSP